MPTPVNFVADAEPWCSYTLDDGSIVKVRIMLVRAQRNGLLPNGQIDYGFQMQQVMDVVPSDLAIASAKEEQARKVEQPK